MLRFLPTNILMVLFEDRLRAFQRAANRYDQAEDGPASDALDDAMHLAFESLEVCAAEIQRRQPIGVYALQRVQALAHMAELKDEPLRLKVS